jgi:hypothetical protein
MTNKQPQSSPGISGLVEALQDVVNLSGHIPFCQECVEALYHNKNLCQAHLKLCTKAISGKEKIRTALLSKRCCDEREAELRDFLEKNYMYADDKELTDGAKLLKQALKIQKLTNENSTLLSKTETTQSKDIEETDFWRELKLDFIKSAEVFEGSYDNIVFDKKVVVAAKELAKFSASQSPLRYYDSKFVKKYVYDFWKAYYKPASIAIFTYNALLSKEQAAKPVSDVWTKEEIKEMHLCKTGDCEHQMQTECEKELIKSQSCRTWLPEFGCDHECCDGVIMDIDAYTEYGSSDDWYIPCPICNKQEFLEELLHGDLDDEEKFGYTFAAWKALDRISKEKLAKPAISDDVVSKEEVIVKANTDDCKGEQGSKGWLPIDHAHFPEGLNVFGLWVNNNKLNKLEWETYLLWRDEENCMRDPDGNYISEWETEDFTHYQTVPQPPIKE